MEKEINAFCKWAHSLSVKGGWYHTPSGRKKKRNIGEMLALIHSEISEGLEGYRKNLMDTHLPNRRMIEVELADALLRIGDLAGYLNLDVGGALVEKAEYNQKRKDHKLEQRLKKNGKKF